MVLELREVQRRLAQQEIQAARAEDRPLQPIYDRQAEEEFAFRRWAIQKLLAADPEEAERYSLDMCYVHFLMELRNLPADEWVPFVQSVVAEHRARMEWGKRTEPLAED